MKVGSTNTTTQPSACCSDSLPAHMYGTGRIIGWWIGGIVVMINYVGDRERATYREQGINSAG